MEREREWRGRRMERERVERKEDGEERESGEEEDGGGWRGGGEHNKKCLHVYEPRVSLVLTSTKLALI